MFKGLLAQVMYHKLVAQNSGLKANSVVMTGLELILAMLLHQVEVTENDNKIKRKDLRIQQLESNLREASFAQCHSLRITGSKVCFEL